MSLGKHLEKRKRLGIIDFIEVPRSRGNAHKEYVVFDTEKQVFSRIFFDNKYREDCFTPYGEMTKVFDELKELEKGLNDVGIYNTTEEYLQKKVEYNFYDKYAYLCPCGCGDDIRAHDYEDNHKKDTL